MLKLAAAKSPPETSLSSYVRPAVLTVAEDGQLFACLQISDRDARVPASVVMRPAPALGEGSRVVVAGEGESGCYVIGVLGDSDAPASERRLSTRGGAAAIVRVLGEREQVEVRDREGRLLFEYDPETGRAAVSVPEGDLALCAPRGNVDIVSAGAVRCQGVGGVLLAAGKPPAAGSGSERPSLALGGGAARLSAPRIDVAGERAELRFTEAAYEGQRLSATVEQAKVVMQRLESAAVQVLQRAKRVFRKVDDVDELVAGRSRTVVEGAITVQGGRASIKAVEEVKIDGKHVYLG